MEEHRADKQVNPADDQMQAKGKAQLHNVKPSEFIKHQ